MDQLLCKRCKKKQPVTGRACCEECLGKQRLIAKTSRERLKKAGLCETCKTNKRREAGIYCEECLLVQKAKREARRTQGCCVYCGDIAIYNRIQCERCKRYSRNLQLRIRNQRREAGICIKCGKNKVAAPHVKCEICLSSQTRSWHKKTKEHLEKGLCVDCGAAPLENHRLCETCYLKKIATKRAGGIAQWQMLKELFNSQGGVCPYTGEKLILGKNAAIDHIVPRKSGGSNEKDNLQWILHQVNTMKWDSSEQDFFTVIRTVYEYRHLGEK